MGFDEVLLDRSQFGRASGPAALTRHLTRHLRKRHVSPDNSQGGALSSLLLLASADFLRQLSEDVGCK
jgi:hypothetical protein